MSFDENIQQKKKYVSYIIVLGYMNQFPLFSYVKGLFISRMKIQGTCIAVACFYLGEKNNMWCLPCEMHIFLFMAANVTLASGFAS